MGDINGNVAENDNKGETKNKNVIRLMHFCVKNDLIITNAKVIILIITENRANNQRCVIRHVEIGNPIIW